MKVVVGGSTSKLARSINQRENYKSIAHLELGGSRRPSLAHRISAMHDDSGNATSDKRWSCKRRVQQGQAGNKYYRDRVGITELRSKDKDGCRENHKGRSWPGCWERYMRESKKLGNAW